MKGTLIAKGELPTNVTQYDMHIKKTKPPLEPVDMSNGPGITATSFLNLVKFGLLVAGTVSPPVRAETLPSPKFALPDRLQNAVRALIPTTPALTRLKLQALTTSELRLLARTLDEARIAPADFRGRKPTRLERAARTKTFSDRDDYRLIFHWSPQESPFPMTEALGPVESMNGRGEELAELGKVRTAPARQFEYNFSAWLSQPDYRCRLPIQAEWFASQFGPPPVQHACGGIYAFPLSSEFGNTIDINPKRVYEIQYVHAGVGQAMESRFGHAMFRIVQCAPHRSSLGEDCRRDKAHQLILSFRARTGGKAPGIIDGLIGEYPLELGALRPSEVQDTYLETELRSIEWLPLRLSRAHIRRFVQRASEIAWSIEGDYKFLTRNCADDSLKLLAVALNDSTILHPRGDTLSPSGLREFLVERGIADINQSVRSKPADQSLEVFYERLSMDAPGTAMQEAIPLRDYLLNSKAEVRRENFRRLLQEFRLAKQRGDSTRAARLKLGLEGWLILEPYCRRVIERELLTAWAQENQERIIEAAENYEKVRLSDRVHSGYGVPTSRQASGLKELRGKVLGENEMRQARDWFLQHFPGRVREVQISTEASLEGQSALLSASD